MAQALFSRRGLVKGASAAGVVLMAGGHTPYGQWTVYRRRNLFIVASRTDEQAVALARSLAEGLAREVPESHARMTRATDPVRVASLLATGQLDVAVVSRDDAAAMLAGTGEYRAVGPAPLRRLASLGVHVMVAVESFRPRHAYILASAVDHLRSELPLPAPTQDDEPPLLTDHAGAVAYRSGDALPPADGGPSQATP
jgi:hypothetical protein